MIEVQIGNKYKIKEDVVLVADRSFDASDETRFVVEGSRDDHFVWLRNEYVEPISNRLSDLPLNTVVVVPAHGVCAYTRTHNGWSWLSTFLGETRHYEETIDYLDHISDTEYQIVYTP